EEVIGFGLVAVGVGDFAEGVGGALHDRLEVEVGVGDVDGQNALRFQVAEVGLKGFAGDEVHGHGVAGEGVHHQQVELLAGLGVEKQAAIAERDFDLGGGATEVDELAAGDLEHERIDFVDAERIAGSSVGGEGAASESENAD